MKIEVFNGFAYLGDILSDKIVFSGGEVHVKIDMDSVGTLVGKGSIINIHHEVKNSQDLMELVMVKNAIDEAVRGSDVNVCLWMMYIPYARQDRFCEPGEAFGVKAFANILNSLKFDEVIVVDPHSDVSRAVIDNLTVIEQDDVAFHMLAWKIKQEFFHLVSPDGGALKKIFKLGKRLGVEVHCAEKVRDTLTGEIIKTNIPVLDFEGQNLMIVDDICDGGRTFIELAKVLKERNAGKVELYVTHGIFSKGVDILSTYIDKIHSFNVWENNVDNTTGVLVENQKEVQKQILC